MAREAWCLATLWRQCQTTKWMVKISKCLQHLKRMFARHRKLLKYVHTYITHSRMHIHISACMHAHTHTHTHHTHLCLHKHVHKYIHVHAYTHNLASITLYYYIIVTLQEKVEQRIPVKTAQKSVPEKKHNLINKGKALVNKVKKK